MSDIVDRLGFGCVGLTGFTRLRDVQALLTGAFDLGIRHFDTAPGYGRGYSEKLLGECFKKQRGKITITTKFGYTPPRASLPTSVALLLNAARRQLQKTSDQQSVADPSPPPMTELPLQPVQTLGRQDLENAFNASRRALKTDYIDFYLLHENVPAALKPEAFDYLQQLKASGAIGKIGLAANGSRYVGLAADELHGWDVLQYESGPAWSQHAGFIGLFRCKCTYSIAA